MTRYTKDFESKVKEYLIDKLQELDYDGFTCYGGDLHNEIFNTDYVVIGTYQAKQEIVENFDDLFIMLDHYQEDFGDAYQDINDVERILNLMYYMCGLELINEITVLTDLWDILITHKDIQNILEEVTQ